MGNTFSAPSEVDAAPRSIWQIWPLRFVVFFFVLLAAYMGCQIAPDLAAPHLKFIPKDLYVIGEAALTMLVMITVYRLLVRLTEKRSAIELDAARSAPLFIAGASIGFALFTGVCMVLWVYGVAAFHGVGAGAGLIAAAAGSLVAGFGEEIAFRGGVFRLLEEGFGTLIALILSGGIFGFMHAGNHGATTASTLAIALEAGVLLASTYVLTRSLWFPIGMHFAWNFTERGIFGAAVSGRASAGLIHTSFSGPANFTGGTFGPEASIVSVCICLIAAVTMLLLAVKRGGWKPMRLRWRT